MPDRNEEYMRRFISLHRKVKIMKYTQKQKYFSISEFFTLSKIYGIAAEENDGECVDKGIPMKKLSAGLRVSPAMVTKTITALEERGCVKRISDSCDRRGVNVCLTRKGYDLWQEEYKFRGMFVKKAFERFGDEKTEQLFSMAEELVDLLEQEAEISCNTEGL